MTIGQSLCLKMAVNHGQPKIISSSRIVAKALQSKIKSTQAKAVPIIRRKKSCKAIEPYAAQLCDVRNSNASATEQFEKIYVNGS